MKIPTTLKIGCHTFWVIFDKKKDGGLDFDAKGHCNYIRNTIAIDTAYPETQQIETFIHEVIHAINNELKETDVQFLAHNLAQVFLDNEISFKLNKKL